MFLIESVNKKKGFNRLELYEDIISFNEEYNNIKESIILQEHSMILEGRSLDYIQEGIVEGVKRILSILINAIKKFILKIKEILIASKNKILEFFSKNKIEEAAVNKTGTTKILDHMKNIVHNCFNMKTSTAFAISLGAVGGTYALISAKMFKDSIAHADDYTQQMIDIAEKEKRDLEQYMKLQEKGDPDGLLAKAIDEKRSRILQVGWAISSMQKSYPLLYRMIKPKKMEQIKSYDKENDPNF